jgi:superfamily I DNA/RNA helicase
MSKKVTHTDWTSAQRQAIEAGPSKKILVDAGPGTGKTATACARVAWLIENQAIEPNQILMTSFTNAAIHEIVNRISSYLSQPEKALGIKISTLDSFSWSLRVGFHAGDLELKGFTENIDQATELLAVDESARDYLKGIEHFIVDEAQDITGPRASLVLSIISNLSSNCGVSIFSDEAQAIYGFTEDETPEYYENTLPKEIRSRKELNSTFIKIDLKEIHRTSDEKLKKLFFEGRRKLLDDKDIAIDKIYEDVRKLVIESHHQKVGTAFEILVKDGKSKDLKSNDFLLFRRRSDALQSSHYMGTIAYRLRLSGFPVLIDAWIARCFWDFTEDRISEADFAELYSKRTEVTDSKEIEMRWRDLHREVGSDAHRISVRKLSNLLARPNVPSCFSLPDYGVSGPILGTIHASKGRETDNVWLFVPNEPHYRKIEEERRFEEVLEEARILFVGATRSRETLVISDTKSGGHFRRSGNMKQSNRS